MAKRVLLVPVLVVIAAAALLSTDLRNGLAQTINIASAPAGPRVANDLQQLEILQGLEEPFLESGETSTIRIGFQNVSGGNVATNSITFTEPSGLTYSELDASCERNVAESTVTCDIATPGAGGRAFVEFKVTAKVTFDTVGEQILTAVSNSSEAFERSSMLVPGVDTPGIESAFLRTAATATPSRVSRGGLVAITLATMNEGPRAVEDTIQALQLPNELTLAETPENCSFSQADRTLTCDPITIEPDEISSIALLANVSNTFPEAGTVVNYGADVGTSSLEQGLRIEGPEAVPFGGCNGCTLSSYTWGDPHLVNFDGLKYDLQTVGEFVYVDLPDGLGDVQIRTAPWRGNNQNASVITRIAADLGSARVEVDLSANVWIDGEPADLIDGDVLDLGDGAQVLRSGGRVVMSWPGAGVRPDLRVDAYGRFINATMRIPDSFAGQMTGLLGNADGDTTNEFALRDGTPLAAQPTATELHTTYADSWRISDDESLFTYGPDESTESFTDLSFPSSIIRVDDFPAEQQLRAEEQCRAFGVDDPIVLDACVFDGLVTGFDPVLAAAALDIPPPEIALDGITSSELVLGDNPLRYYQFTDGSAADRTGSGFDVQISGATTLVQGPILNQPDFALRSTSGVAATAPSTGLPAGDSERTIEFWVNPVTTNSNSFFNWVTYGDFRVLHRHSSRQIQVAVGNSTVGLWTSPESLGGSWHHVAITYDGQGLRLHLNGLDLGPQQATLNTDLTAGTLDIGRLGAFDEVAIYDRVITPREIVDRWGVGLSADGQPCRNTIEDTYGQSVRSSSPSRYYRFEETTDDGRPGRLAIDSSANCVPGYVAPSTVVDESSPVGNGVRRNDATAVYAPSVGLPAGDSERTIEFWVNPVTTNSNSFFNWVTYGDFRVLHRHSSRQIQVAVGDTTVGLWSTQEFLSEAWQHIAITYDGENLNLYVNGEDLGARAADLDTNLTGTLNIGRLGSLDELAIYPTALDPQTFDDRWRGILDVFGVQPCAAAPTDAYGQAIVANDPVSYYRFEEFPETSPIGPRLTPDAGSICVPGFIRNGAAVDESSPVGNGVRRNDATAVYAPSVGLPAGDSERTIEFWVNPVTTNSNSFFNWVTYGDFRVLHRHSSRQIQVAVGDTTVGLWSTQEFLSEAWQHIAITYDGENLNLYVNGEDLGARAADLDTNLTGTLNIGRLGSLDELAIYPTALDPQTFDDRWRGILDVFGVQPCAAAPTDAYGQAIVANDPVSYYRFEEFPETSPIGPRLTPDAGSICVPGFIRNGAAVDESSPVGNGVRRNDATAVYAPSVGLPAGDSERTIEFWVNPVTTNSNSFFNWVTYGDFRVLHRHSSRQIQVAVGDTTVGLWSTQEFLSEAWQHIAITYDGENLNLYVNGEDLGARAADLDTNLTGTLNIGRLGSLDELAIYPTALDPQTFDDRWRGILDVFGVQPCAAAPTDAYGQAIVANDPVSYYRFEEFPETSPIGPRLTPDAGSICVPGFIRNGAAVDESSPVGNGVRRNDATAVYAPSVGLPAGDSERTIEFWVNPVTTNSNSFFNWVTYGDFRVLHRHSSRQIQVAVGDTTVGLWSTQEFLSEAWQHIAITYDGENLNLYVNGEDLGARAADLDTNLTGTLNIGRLGSLDELAIYPTALDPQTFDSR